MSRIRKEIIYSKLKELKNSLHYLKEYLPSDSKYLEDRGRRNMLYKEAEFAIQLVIDVCAIINSDLSKEPPVDEDSLFDFVEKAKIVDSNLVKKLREMKGFRNLLFHRYGNIDNDVAYDNIKSGLSDFEEFIKKIEKFLEQYPKEEKGHREH